MRKLADRLPLTEEERQVLYLWHGGQGDILYAAASTGALARGTQRPVVDGESLDDDAWLYRLVLDFERAIDRTIDLVKTEPHPRLNEIRVLRGLAKKVSRFGSAYRKHYPGRGAQ